MKENKHYNIVILGAGLSGIGAAYHFQTKCPYHTYTILEARETMGGTWDYFKYPGLRSDSDMFTLGYPFRPWKEAKAIADGPSILNYIKDTAAEFGIDKKIQYQHKVVKANWNSEEKKWFLDILENDSISKTITCDFFFSCSGYYSYKEGYTPDFKNSSSFKGTIMHPQKWDTNYDYSNKKIVIIGSGATAITLVPELAKKAAHVTMLQRSPTYISSLPKKDKVVEFFKKVFPSKMAHFLSRWKNIFFSVFVYQFSMLWPETMKNVLLKNVKKALKDKADIAKDYTPRYNPWEERLCVVPDGDFFKAIQNDKAGIVTEHIDQFTENGILLKNGEELEADLIVTATGLKIELVGGVEMQLDNEGGNSAELHSYRGVMLSELPNFGISMGYTNASWTLKCDLNCQYFCRVLNYMHKNNYKTFVPVVDEKYKTDEALLDLKSGYVKRAADILPRQGTKSPWRVYQNYIVDLFSTKYSKIKGTGLEFE